jgi:menaquinol-cytochrome c reductase iron-sulfur subunit
MPKPKPTSDASSPAPRRSFLALLTALGGVLATAMVAIPGVGYLTAAVRRQRGEGENWVNLGPVGDYPANETRLKTFENPLAQAWDGICAQTGVWVRNLGRDEKYQERFNVFAINCTHLGCPVEWFPQSGLFMCPCHGGVYYEDGARASGPPPRGLYHCVSRVRDGNLEIQAPFLPTLQNTLTGHDKA